MVRNGNNFVISAIFNQSPCMLISETTLEIVNQEETAHGQEMIESNELEDEEDFYHTVFSSVQEMYKKGLFCDLVLLPAGCSNNEQTLGVADRGSLDPVETLGGIKCHTLVLARYSH